MGNGASKSFSKSLLERSIKTHSEETTTTSTQSTIDSSALQKEQKGSKGKQNVSVSEPHNITMSKITPSGVAAFDISKENQVDAENGPREATLSPKRRVNHSTNGKICWKKGELIGAGTHGKVFTALNEDTGSLMAVKEIQFSKDDLEEVENIQREVQLLSSLSHENIVEYIGTECSNGTLYIFTEWVQGNLQQLQKKFKTLSESVVRKYTQQILEALVYLHDRQIIHRDIKGANILLDDRGTVKLTDLGASKRMGGSTLTTNNQSLKGTPYYMAPEVVRQSQYGRKADIWSTGCTVIQLLTGNPPWKELNIESPAALLFKIASATEPPPLPEGLSEEARDFLKQCFIGDPNLRPSARELLKHPFILEEPLSTKKTPIPATVQVEMQPRKLRSPKKIEIQKTPPAAQSIESNNATLSKIKLRDTTKSPDPSDCSEANAEALQSVSELESAQAKTELLRNKQRRNNHQRRQGKLNPINDPPALKPPMPPLEERDSWKRREEMPIATSYAQRQLQLEMEEKKRREDAERKKKELWEQELQAELRYRTSSSRI